MIKKFVNNKSTSNKSKKLEHHGSYRDRLTKLVKIGAVDPVEALTRCIDTMSEDDCEWVMHDLAELALWGDACEDGDCEQGVSLVDDDVDDIEDDDELDEDEDADDEACKRRELEARIRRMERMIKNSK